MSNTWLVYFDSDGFECIMNVTQIAQDNMIKRLSDEPLQGIPLEQMKLRARFNSQRRPEIWVFNSADEIDEETLWSVANDNPQFLADWIRKNGTPLFGDTKGMKKNKRIV